MNFSIKKTPEWLYILMLCSTGISVVSQGFIMIPIEKQLIFHFHIQKYIVYLSGSLLNVILHQLHPQQKFSYSPPNTF
jgi:hypothetical protein